MFWGDPLAEFPSLDILGTAENDPDLITGYYGRETAPFDESARTRVRLYRSYLYLIMLTEAVPRGFSEQSATGLGAHVGPALERSLRELAATGRGRQRDP